MPQAPPTVRDVTNWLTRHPDTLTMRRAIEHGQAGPSGEADKLGLARLLLSVTDLMVSGEGRSAMVTELTIAEAEDLLRVITEQPPYLPQPRRPQVVSIPRHPHPVGSCLAVTP